MVREIMIKDRNNGSEKLRDNHQKSINIKGKRKEISIGKGIPTAVIIIISTLKRKSCE